MMVGTSVPLRTLGARASYADKAPLAAPNARLTARSVRPGTAPHADGIRMRVPRFVHRAASAQAV
jgi:hypothetical protein